MAIGRLALMFMVLLFVAAPLSQARQADQLPPGIASVEVDGQPIDAANVPTANGASPSIAGRSELGVPTLELSVSSGGEVVQFSTDVDERGRFRVDVPQPLAPGQYTLDIAGLPIGAFAVPGEDEARSSTRQPGPLLDIARVVPYPADFDGAIPGLGFLDGQFFTLPEEARRTAANGDGDTDERQTERALAEAGWLQRYESRLAAPDPENPDLFTAQASSFVVEYSSAEDARATFATLTAEDAAATATSIGDQSSLALIAGTTPDTGTGYQAARLTFRVGPMLAVIVFADLRNQQPDLALVQLVAQRVAERAAVVATRQTTPLGTMALRLNPEPTTGRISRRDVYDVRAATLTPLYDEDEATAAGRLELFSGTTDAFAATTAGTLEQSGRGSRAVREEESAPAISPTSVIAIEGESAAPVVIETPTAETTVSEAASATAQVFMMTSLYAFPDDAAADAWFGDQVARVRDSSETAGAFTEVDNAIALGDASAVFATRRATGDEGQTSSGFRLYSRVGPINTVLEFTTTSELRLESAAKLMEFQIACIEQGSCTGLVSLRDSIFAADEEPVLEQRTPLPQREQSAAETPVAPTAAAPPPIVIQEPTAVPVEEAPPPVEETPPPAQEPAPPAEETPPPPAEATPPPSEEATPPPAEATPPPAEEATPPPAAETPPAQETPPPAEETPPPAEEPTPAPTTPPVTEEPTAVPTPAPDVDPEPTAEPDKGNRDNDRDRRDRRDRDKDKDKKS